MEHKRIFGLDIPRAFAIILVLVSHFFKKIDILGFFGVELFFALSGYLLGSIMWRNFNSTVSLNTVFNFWQRRWFRTLPNYYLFLVIMIPFHLYVYNEKLVLRVINEYLYFGQNLLKVSDGFYSVSWSLCVEEWFYLLFPVSIFVFRKIGFRNLHSFLITIFIFYLGCFLIRNNLATNGVNNIRMVALGRLDAISSGVLIAVIRINFKIIQSNWLALIGCGILITNFYLVFVDDFIYYSSSVLLFMTPLSFALILPQITKLQLPDQKFHFFKIVVTNLSLWSYSIYLSHIPILFTIYYLTNNSDNNNFTKLIVKGLAFFLILGVSKILYKYFEIPITNKRPKELKN